MKQIKNRVKDCQTLSWEKLKGFEFNDLKDGTRDISRLKNAIVNEGFCFPLYVWHGHRYVIDGNGRNLALSDLEKEGYEVCDLPVVYLEAPTKQAAKKLVLMASSQHGKVSQDSFNVFVEDLDVEALVDDINLPDIEVTLEDDEESLVDEETEETIEPPAEPKTKLGDLYELNGHRILCGDSTLEENVQKLMNGQKAEMVLTDPPYGMNLDTDFSTMGLKSDNSPASKTYKKVLNDDKPYDPAHIFRDFDYCKEIFLWGADYYAERIPDKNAGSWITWDKRAGIEDAYWATSEFELCWSRTKHHRKIARFTWSGMLGMEQEKQEYEGSKPPVRVHPNQKPTALYKWFFDHWGKDKNLIVDLFLGSGSLLIAAEQTGRLCYGMELDPAYVDVIISRWLKFMQNTGRATTLKRNGKKIKPEEFA